MEPANRTPGGPARRRLLSTDGSYCKQVVSQFLTPFIHLADRTPPATAPLGVAGWDCGCVRGLPSAR